LAPSALPVPQRQPKASSSALPAQPVPAKASSSALPVQPTASSLALPLQQALAKVSTSAPRRLPELAQVIRVKRVPAPREVQSEEEVIEEEENEEELKQTAERKPRSKPLRGDEEMDPPCLRCIGKGITCWMQVRPTKACYDCGRQKLGCTRQGVDRSAGSTQPKKSQASAKATAPPTQPTQKAKGKKVHRKSDVPDSTSEVEVVESRPRPKAKSRPQPSSPSAMPTTSARGIRRPRESSSPIPQFSAIEKGKGKAGAEDEFQDSLTDRMGYLEEIMDGIKGDPSRGS
ncbi:hypothetical protein BYT27DRAFT_7265739, partial [Phlegmacium glaucopus]